jgi:hypothetical protein
VLENFDAAAAAEPTLRLYADVAARRQSVSQTHERAATPLT